MYHGYIYKITNKINGHAYIGKTNNLDRRWHEHKSGNGGTAILDKAFKKYGINNFKFEKIFEFTSLDIVSLNLILNKLEVYYISKFDTFKHGYNATIGGEGTSYYKHSEQTKKKISQSNKGKKLSPERRRKCGLAMKGKHHTKEVCQKIRIALLNRPHSLYESLGNKLRGRKRDHDVIMKGAIKRRKPVIQYDLNGNFIKEYEGSSVIPNIAEANIIACCKGKLNSAYGYIWRYKDDTTPLVVPTNYHIANRAISQFSKEGIFINNYPSATIAAQITSIGRKSIVNCLTGRSKSAGGYLWKYKEAI